MASRSSIYASEMYKLVSDNFENAFKSQNRFRTIKTLIGQVKRWDLDSHLKAVSDKIDDIQSDIADTGVLLHNINEMISQI